MNDFIFNLDQFPKSHVIQFKYYSGKHLMFQERYKKAKEELDYALKYCHKDSKKKKIKILEILIPTNLLFGIFPNEKLFKKYSISHLQILVEAAKLGYPKLFQEQIDQNQQMYIDKGIFLLFTHVEPLIFRKIIAKTMVFRTKQFKRKEIKLKPNIIPINILKQALFVSNCPMLYIELECIIANLIWKGAMKGYIAHEKALVLSKNDPFPNLLSSLKFNK